MRVVDLDRDMSDVIPTGTTRDSEYLFARMTEVTLDLARVGGRPRILDVASGFGQDAMSLAANGAWVVGAEPSGRMTAWSRIRSAEAKGSLPGWVRGWADALPFASGSFDAVFCKGAIDHFDRPEDAIAEMARVTRPDGRVVLAIANFESLSCRAARLADDVREQLLSRGVSRGRRHYDVPADHFTRYEIDLMREQASRWLEVTHVEGVSLAWGLPIWTRSVDRLPRWLSDVLLQGLDRVARQAPQLADVVVLAGKPRPQAPSFATSR